MENHHEENPRVKRTRESIQNAFKELVLNGRSKDINVKKITEVAGIHRKTFYLHYTCIEALYEDIIQKIVLDYGKEVKKLTIPYDYYELTKVMFEFYTSDPFYEKMITDPKYQDFSNKIMVTNLMHNRYDYNPFEKYTEDEQMLINMFLASASTDIFRQWVNSNKKIPMKKVIELTGRLLENGVSSMRN
ncbi:MAG: TetR/AcrR family transcriptional regulator [Clostridium sp.]|uniref:TetR/AcrR family transcriptional regulator n=1 Tax=Clostridium sp. DSM 8431 TaxID=1761781 RepID=UPI0008E2E7D7|nr:TetR/AcrR family transcriptional regulator [Clostridium sp. DSM 8431]MCR4943729.1 TetR/AcrR family transcriptional regulator [Clostridium sp.]SFU86922.1 transcriptional regulator, TetR family [Clostridium sp. DSM 8431]